MDAFKHLKFKKIADNVFSYWRRHCRQATFTVYLSSTSPAVHYTRKYFYEHVADSELEYNLGKKSQFQLSLRVSLYLDNYSFTIL